MARGVQARRVLPAGEAAALAAANLGLARWYAGRVARRLAGRLDREDVEGAALLGLVEAARRYDPARGVAFGTYAVYHLRRRVQEAARRGGAVSHPPPAGVAPGDRARLGAACRRALPLAGHDRADPAPGPAEEAARAEGLARLRAALRRLPARDRRVVGAVAAGGTVTAAAAALGVSRTRADQLYRRGLARLRGLLAPAKAEGGA